MGGVSGVLVEVGLFYGNGVLEKFYLAEIVPSRKYIIFFAPVN